MKNTALTIPENMDIQDFLVSERKHIYWTNLKKKHTEQIDIFVKRLYVQGIQDFNLLSEYVAQIYKVNLSWARDRVAFLYWNGIGIGNKSQQRLINKIKKERMVSNEN